MLGDRDLSNRVGKKILAGPEQKLPLERRNFGNYFLENEATRYIEHFTSSCILFIALLDKNIRNIKIENLRKFQKKLERDGLFQNYFREICKSYGILVLRFSKRQMKVLHEFSITVFLTSFISEARVVLTWRQTSNAEFLRKKRFYFFYGKLLEILGTSLELFYSVSRFSSPLKNLKFFNSYHFGATGRWSRWKKKKKKKKNYESSSVAPQHNYIDGF